MPDSKNGFPERPEYRPTKRALREAEKFRLDRLKKKIEDERWYDRRPNTDPNFALNEVAFRRGFSEGIEYILDFIDLCPNDRKLIKAYFEKVRRWRDRLQEKPRPDPPPFPHGEFADREIFRQYRTTRKKLEKR